MNDTDLAFASIEEIGKLFRKRKLSPVQLTKLMLGRIERLNPKLNAFLTVTTELALAQAKRAESELFAPRGRKGYRDRGLLHGVPISLKDNIYTKGIRTTAGSKILDDFMPKEDATVVGQLREAGAVLLGKTNMHEYAYGVTCNNPHFGPVRNPWDLSRISGGSSGGSAAAVAAGLCYGSIGTDTGGSIRIPAALCGIVGLKPHYRRVSTSGVVPLSMTLDHVGPLARSAVDAAVLLGAITSGGYLDRSVEKALIPFTFRGINELRHRPTKPFHLGIPSDYFWDRIDGEIHKIVMNALEEKSSARFVLHKTQASPVHKWTDPSTSIALADATEFHQRSGWFPSRAKEYGQDVRTRLEMGLEVRAVDYLAALDMRTMAWLALFGPGVAGVGMLDALVVPTTPFAATEIGAEEISINGEKEKVRAGLLRLNRPANFAGLPSISIPCGFTSSGLPVGLQIIGQSWQEKKILQIAHAFESAHDYHMRRPPLAV
jgi:aspartyl-tRNA(Asn)/glutamyl-tRNA(Gln) amidotransferase subunit A